MKLTTSFLALFIVSLYARSTWSLCHFYGDRYGGANLVISAVGTPWLNGPNVCKREYTNETTTDYKGNRTKCSCNYYQNAYVCKSSITSKNVETTKTVVYECCHGFDRTFGEKGCSQKIQLTPLVDKLNELKLSQFATAFQRSGLADMYKNKNMTIFAPTNEALTESSSAAANEISQVVVFETGDTMHPIRDILMNGMVEGMVHTYDMDDNEPLPTLRQDSRLVVRHHGDFGKTVTVNCVRIRKSDQPFSNGIIHVVDQMLQPAAKSIWDLLSSNPKFRYFVSLINEETKQKLQSPTESLTVIAFTDDAFTKLPQHQQHKIRSQASCYKGLCSRALLESNAGTLIRATLSPSGDLLLNNVTVSGKDAVALNGVVHTIDEVFMPRQTLDAVENLASTAPKMHSMLVETGLADAVKEKSVSVLIPPPYAIEDLADKSNVEKRNELSRYLFSGEIKSDNDGTQMITSMANEPLKITVSKPSFPFFTNLNSRSPTRRVNCAKLGSWEGAACGGTLYHMRKPLPPYARTFMELLRKDKSLTQFTTLVEAAGLDSKLNDPTFSGTVMTFTDSSFDEMFDSKKKADLLADKKKLQSFIGNHILTKPYCCHELTSDPFDFTGRNTYPTLDGRNVAISGSECCLRFGQPAITQCDTGVTENGVMHMLKRPYSADETVSGMSPFGPFGISFIGNPMIGSFEQF
ncbi:Putative transforming growth factor-beta-induced protein ig-h3 [Trichuris trichiura]|uniref:Putative transforming growth factor-beta-induced protein ig-h3 n=1 Tax=Trichuris trichiura TaxID=36087 RepID=A0A077ZAA9_TRITR|nr:Putative transforming growth factor-beta-induced protein ig-h3 [Trichuris trichiura]